MSYAIRLGILLLTSEIRTGSNMSTAPSLAVDEDAPIALVGAASPNSEGIEYPPEPVAASRAAFSWFSSKVATT